MFKDSLKNLTRLFGYDISRFHPRHHNLARLKHFFSYYDIDLVIDIGANCGQFGIELRKTLKYPNRIISFEPLSDPFLSLQRVCSDDSLWDCHQFAMGNREGEETIHVSGNLVSSSILTMMSSHEEVAPDSKVERNETIQIRTVDSQFDTHFSSSKNIFLKIDTQGYEMQVLQGAQDSLTHFKMIQLEMSLSPLYQGEALFGELHQYLTSNGFTLIGLMNGLAEPKSCELLQVDGIYRNMKSA